ncbi:MAG TPA: DNA-directed RNA polymerase subunit omega [Syntrophobacter fumaroxidans]|nr:DNA-directed RNA polymerase subunit omega [Syntrophobacter fumaroxidans]
MARVTIEDCLKEVDSRFTLVHLAVRRVLQLRGGAPPLTEVRNKEVVLALREIAAGKVTVDNIRRLEEAKALPEPAAVTQKEDVARLELKEIMDEATLYDASMEFDEAQQVVEPDVEPSEES